MLRTVAKDGAHQALTQSKPGVELTQATHAADMA
jgi:hypothetical protein